MTKRRLGELLQAEGLISDEQLRQGLEEQRRSNMFLGEALVKLGYVSEEAIAQTIVQQFSLPFISANQYNIGIDVLNLFPERMYYEYQFVALDKIGKVLVICGAGLMNHDVLDELERLTDCKVCQFVSTWKDIRNVLEKYAKDLRKEQENLSNLGAMLLEGNAPPAIPLPKPAVVDTAAAIKLAPPKTTGMVPPKPGSPVPAPAVPGLAAVTAPVPPPSGTPAVPSRPGTLVLTPPKVVTGISANAVAKIASAPSGTAVIPPAAAAPPAQPVPAGSTTGPQSPRLSALAGVRPPGGTQQVKVAPPSPSAVVNKDGASPPAASESGKLPQPGSKTGLLGLFKKS